MTLDVEVPDPPSLRRPQVRGEYEAIDMTDQEPTDDHRREELEKFLREGAWWDAFEELAEHTFLTDEEFETLRELGLVERFDLYWDPATDDVGYRAPTLSDDERGVRRPRRYRGGARLPRPGGLRDPRERLPPARRGRVRVLRGRLHREADYDG